MDLANGYDTQRAPPIDDEFVNYQIDTIIIKVRILSIWVRILVRIPMKTHIRIEMRNQVDSLEIIIQIDCCMWIQLPFAHYYNDSSTSSLSKIFSCSILYIFTSMFTLIHGHIFYLFNLFTHSCTLILTLSHIHSHVQSITFQYSATTNCRL